MELMRVNNAQMGRLSVSVVDEANSWPIAGARVWIYTGGEEELIQELNTDENGQTSDVSLSAPPLEYSMEPGVNRPYSEYTVRVEASGYQECVINGVEIMSGIRSLCEVRLFSEAGPVGDDVIVIPANTLYGDYPPKLEEKQVVPVTPGQIVLEKVVVPGTIVVHDGVPSDSSATNYYVSYGDYIKNVACCEIYATWPRETIKANVLAIMSFTLNRVYTEFYRNKGYNFTITSSTAYDHKWVYGRNIFDSIAEVVDELIGNYLSKPNVKQPILAQYCDGKKVTCPDRLSQWGSKYLGDQNYLAIDILKYYYGDSLYINMAESVEGIPYSWPGYNLDIGSSGSAVASLQMELNAIGEHYTGMPVLSIDGIFGEMTASAVKRFQTIFGMNPTGAVDFPTWYRISEKYVAVTKASE